MLGTCVPALRLWMSGQGSDLRALKTRAHSSSWTTKKERVGQVEDRLLRDAERSQKYVQKLCARTLAAGFWVKF